MSSWLSGHPARQFVAVGLFLWAGTMFLHGSALYGNWRADDGDHLRFALTHEPWQYFFVPEVNRAHHAATITPWNVFFYDINLALFGFTPKGHYFHLLCLISLSAWLLYAVLRQWFEWPSALAGASALLLFGPTIHIAQFLMVGHYAAGLVFCLAAAYGWVRFAKGGGASWLAMGAAFYLLAALCKEVCLPLILLLPFLDAGSPGRRLRALVPFAGVAIAYTAWRRVVLGLFVGGYSPTGEGFIPTETLRQLARVPHLLFGQGWPGAVGVLALAVGAFLAWRDGRIRWLPLLALMAAVLLPLVPLTIVPGIRSADRYLFFPAVAMAAAIAVVWPRRSDPLWRSVLAVCIVVTLAIAHVRQARSINSDLRQMDTLSAFALSADRKSQGLFIENDPGYLMSVLNAAGVARDLFEGKPPGVKLVVLTNTPAALPALSGSDWFKKTYYQYDGRAMRQMAPEEISKAVAPELEALKRGQERELRVELAHDSGTLRWEFGPWDGTYQVNLDDGGVRLPRTGAYPWDADRPLELSVCFEGREDWVACSPRLTFEPRKRSLVWSGTGVSRGLEAAPSPP